MPRAEIRAKASRPLSSLPSLLAMTARWPRVDARNAKLNGAPPRSGPVGSRSQRTSPKLTMVAPLSVECGCAEGDLISAGSAGGGRTAPGLDHVNAGAPRILRIRLVVQVGEGR